ncbi:MAG: hypothetical protein ABIN24_12940 [Dyadobacter sp.]
MIDEKVLSFNENQLKRSGFGDAFTAELKAQMEQGIPLIQYSFHKEYDGDQLQATLHLKKSSVSDYYSLKKFDLQLQKEGLATAVKHSFNITDTNFGTNKIDGQHYKNENRLTLQEAYNLLSGRSVYKYLSNADGIQEHAWVKLNLKNDLRNNNTNKTIYQTNRGFDLEKVLNNYPIKELNAKGSKHALIQSLQRGNVKKVTFIGHKKQEEHLYISPNPILGILNVYDKHKQRLSTSEMVDKNYIGRDFALRVGDTSNQQKQVETKNIKMENRIQKLSPKEEDKISDLMSKKFQKHKIR